MSENFKLKLSRHYYVDLQKESVNNFDFDAIYVDFYPKDIWEAETRIPYLFEEDVYKEDNEQLKELLLHFGLPKDMVEADSSFSFYILDPENKKKIVDGLATVTDQITMRELPNTCDTIPDAHKLVYCIQPVSFKPTESGPQETESEQTAVFIMPKKMLDVYKNSGVFEDVEIINQDNWCALDHRFSFDMKTQALNKHNIAFDLINVNGILFPCYPEDIDEKLPTDEYCNDVPLLEKIFTECGMEPNEDLQRLSDMIIAQIGLQTSLS